MTIAMNLKNIALAAIVGIGAAGISASDASAMTVHNCTDSSLRVVLMDRNGNFNQPVSIGSYATSQIHATNSYGPYRIVLPDLGAGAHFSGRHGDGIFSLIRTEGGNIGIRNGHTCPQPARQLGG